MDTTTGAILERRLGVKRVEVRPLAGGGMRRVEPEESEVKASLSDDQIHALAALGARVEACYGAPQDTEWAIDAGGKI